MPTTKPSRQALRGAVLDLEAKCREILETEDPDLIERAAAVLLDLLLESGTRGSHVHTRECYDDAGPGAGGVSLLCNRGHYWND